MHEKENIDMQHHSFDPRAFLTGDVMERRLDTESLIRQLKLFLMAKRIDIEIDENGVKREIVVPIHPGAQPLVNDKGINGILFWLSSTFNTSNVQGNLERDAYEFFISQFHRSFAVICMTNLHEWDIKLDNYVLIVRSVVYLAYLFVSRTIDNLERTSYGQSMVSQTSTHNLVRGGGMTLPILGGGGN